MTVNWRSINAQTYATHEQFQLFVEFGGNVWSWDITQNNAENPFASGTADTREEGMEAAENAMKKFLEKATAFKTLRAKTMPMWTVSVEGTEGMMGIFKFARQEDAIAFMDATRGAANVVGCVLWDTNMHRAS